MAQIAGQGRLLVRLIVIKKLLLAGVLFAISLAAVFGDVHYAELSDFAETWGNADRQFLSSNQLLHQNIVTVLSRVGNCSIQLFRSFDEMHSHT